jgi:transposase
MGVVKFATTTPELLGLADWLGERRATLMGMEATGVYWNPAQWVPEVSVTEVWVVNARHMRNVPDRKTDVADPVGCVGARAWLGLAELHTPESFRALRDLTRYRKSMIGERAGESQRLHKVLEDACVSSPA